LIGAATRIEKLIESEEISAAGVIAVSKIETHRRHALKRIAPAACGELVSTDGVRLPRGQIRVIQNKLRVPTRANKHAADEGLIDEHKLASGERYRSVPGAGNTGSVQFDA
jgi:hypothetical protein